MPKNDSMIARQQEKIALVSKWLKDEGYDVQERTHLRKDSAYFGVVPIDETSSFHVIFPSDRLDSVVILEIIELAADYKNSYLLSHPTVKQKFFLDLRLSLLHMNVIFLLEKGIENLESLEVKDVIYFDGLTKDKFFHTAFHVHHAIEIARTKLGQFVGSLSDTK